MACELWGSAVYCSGRMAAMQESESGANRREVASAILLILLAIQAAASEPTSRKTETMTAMTARRHTNRLAQATSPYLLQHAHNPVDWWPWCDEALEKARKEDKPIFLSIGYSACHWCHVMEH